jgi:nicastrin
VASGGPKYPLGYSTPSANIAYGNTNFPWNGNGDGLNQYDLYGIPVAYVNEEGPSKYIRQAAQSQELANEIFSDFNYYMGPDGIKATECLAWEDAHNGEWSPKCLPLGGVSVWGFAGSPPTQQVYKQQYDNNVDEGDDAANADADEDEEDEDNGERKLEANVQQSYKPSIVVGTSIDSTSMFHDLVPGANEGASNTLSLLMAAYLIGQNLDDETLDALNNRIVFGFFEGEAYGYTGSRNFLNDVLNFECDDDYLVNSVSNDQNSELACLYPMRPSMKFKDIGEIAGMLTVDQVGIPMSDDTLFVHNEGEGGMGTFMANVLKSSGTQYFSAVSSAAYNNNDNGGDYPYPPTAFTALQGISGGTYSGAVLTGYDYVFTKRPPYHSHLNWATYNTVDMKAVAAAATLIARTALAAAYDNGGYDYETAANYAVNIIPELDYNNQMLEDLADCLLVNGNCQLFQNYGAQEAKNERSRTNFDIGAGKSLGMPPNYYVGVYTVDYGQPFVRVSDKIYGSYNGNDYGNKSSDGIAMQPRMKQQAIRNLLHDFLGRGQLNGSKGKGCSKESDCQNVNYCATDGDSATCTAGGQCVCKRAYFHVALDTALTPAVNESPGKFSLYQDEGTTPLWVEPYWSSTVGVKMYRDSVQGPGYLTLAVGLVVSLMVFSFTKKVKAGLKKEKVY